MEIFLAVVVIFGLAILGMAVGVIFSNRCLRGSCGGLGAMRDEQGRSLCEACTTPSENCTKMSRDAAAEGETQASEPYAAHR